MEEMILVYDHWHREFKVILSSVVFVSMRWFHLMDDEGQIEFVPACHMVNMDQLTNVGGNVRAVLDALRTVNATKVDICTGHSFMWDLRKRNVL